MKRSVLGSTTRAALLGVGLAWAAGGAGAADGPPALDRAKVPAFPGAEGAGAYTAGGRGGRSIAVTTLADRGPGSFRAAVEAEGPRVVTFRVAGLITLESPVEIDHPYLTLAGQTAPGDGVCVRGQSVHINTHDVVIRYMRFRRGNMEVRDDALGGNPVGNVILDHVSASWGLDENMSLYRHMFKSGGPKDQKLATENLTIQWSVTSEALDRNHHAFGGTWGGDNCTFHHNLFACNTGRNPSMGMGGTFDFRNNVLFNWKHRTIDGGDGSSRVNLVNNYFKPGPATTDADLRTRIVKLEDRSEKYEFPGAGIFYVAGNRVDGSPQVTADNWAGVQYTEVRDPKTGAVTVKGKDRPHRADEPFPYPPIAMQSAEEAYEAVLADVGATLPVRDPVDVRVLESVRTGKPTFQDGIIDSPADVGGWPEYRTAPAPADGDGDGIPDAFESAHGLDPADPADAARDADGDGYTAIEEYLNGTDPAAFVDYNKPEHNRNTLPKPKAAPAVGAGR